MLENSRRSSLSGLRRKVSALLLALAIQIPLSAVAQEVLNNAMQLSSGMSMGGGGSTNITDICANMPDKVACANKLGANQIKMKQAQTEQDITLLPIMLQKEKKRINFPKRTEFQKFIADSVGKDLPLYGYNLFDGYPDTFAPVENIPVTPDYLNWSRR